MGNTDDRRARTKARLQEKLVQRRTGEGQVLGSEDLQKLCEEDFSRLLILLHALKWPANLQSQSEVPWNSLIQYFELRMENMEGYMQRYPGKSEFIGGENRRSDKEDNWGEAKIIFARLKTRVARLPEDCMLHDWQRLHFREGVPGGSAATVANAAAAAAHPRVNGDHGQAASEAFMGLVKHFRRLNVPITTHFTKNTGPPKTAQEWEIASRSLISSWFELRRRQASGEIDPRQERQLPAIQEKMEILSQSIMLYEASSLEEGRERVSTQRQPGRR